MTENKYLNKFFWNQSQKTELAEELIEHFYQILQERNVEKYDIHVMDNVRKKTTLHFVKGIDRYMLMLDWSKMPTFMSPRQRKNYISDSKRNIEQVVRDILKEP